MSFEHFTPMGGFTPENVGKQEKEELEKEKTKNQEMQETDPEEDPKKIKIKKDQHLTPMGGIHVEIEKGQDRAE